MKNFIKRKYHFESTHVPYSVKNIEVEKNGGTYTYVVDDVKHILDISARSLIRRNSEMEMLFDFETNQGSVKLIELGNTLPFDIIAADLKVEENVIHLDFKYVLDQEMYVSLSIV